MTRSFYVVDPAYSNLEIVGHYNHYAQAILGEAYEHFDKVKILGKNDGKSDQGNVIPIFDFDIWGAHVKNDGSLKSIEDSNESFYLALKKYFLFEEHSNVDLFLPNATPFNILGMCKFISENPNNFSVVCLLRYEATMYRHLLSSQNLLYIQKAMDSLKIKMASDSPLLIESYRDLLVWNNVSFIPHFVAPSFKRTHVSGSKPPKYFKIGALGNARGEKGTNLVLQAAIALKDFCLQRQIKFYIQVNNPSSDIENFLIDYNPERNPHIELIHKPLSEDEYFELFSDMNLVVLPYSPTVYQGRTSGILTESMFLKIPTIVTSGTWLDYESQRYGGSVTCNFSLSSLIQAIPKAYKNYDHLTWQLETSHQLVVSEHSPSSGWNSLSKLFANFTEPQYVIFFPWGFNDLMASGTGTRLNQVITKLKSQNFTFKVVILNCWSDLDDSIREIGDDYVEVSYLLKPDSPLQRALHLGEFNDTVLQYFAGMGIQNSRIIFIGSFAVKPIMDLYPLLKHKPILEIQDFYENSNQFGLDIEEFQLASIEKCKSYAISLDDTIKIRSKGFVIEHSDPTLEMSGELFSDLKLELAIQRLPSNFDFTKIVLFVGSDYPPNHEAVSFLESVAKSMIGQDIGIVVIGGVGVGKKSSTNLFYSGYVSAPLLSGFYGLCDLAVNPMFSGGGIPIKVLEALKFNKPVLATVKGARGLSDSNLRSVKVLDLEKKSFKQFAEELSRILEGDTEVVPEHSLLGSPKAPDNFLQFLGVNPSSEFNSFDEEFIDLLIELIDHNYEDPIAHLINFDSEAEISWLSGFIFALYLSTFMSGIAPNLGRFCNCTSYNQLIGVFKELNFNDLRIELPHYILPHSLLDQVLSLFEIQTPALRVRLLEITSNLMSQAVEELHSGPTNFSRKRIEITPLLVLARLNLTQYLVYFARYLEKSGKGRLYVFIRKYGLRVLKVKFKLLR